MLLQEKTYGFYNPCISLMGIGCHRELGARILSLGGSKPFLVTDEGMTRVGLTAQIVDLIRKDTGLDARVYDQAVPNPTDDNVHNGHALYKEHACDMIITLGGGSAHDCGKGIGIVAANGGRIHDYEGVDKLHGPMPPFIAINTTAGTASEMTRFCIITDTSRHVKMAIIDWRTTPNIAINDPCLMVGMPPFLTACTGMDALTHAVEAYVSTSATPITDACALQAIQLISASLRPAVANGSDLEARDSMAYAEYLAGMAFNNAGLGYVHAMAHQLGGLYNLAHGLCNAILLPHVCRFNLISQVGRFGNIADALGEDLSGLSARQAADKAPEAILTLAKDVGIPAGLRELNVQSHDLTIMAGNAMNDPCGLTNPRRPELRDVIAIYTSAMESSPPRGF